MRQTAGKNAQRRDSTALGARAPGTQLLQQLDCGQSGAGSAPMCGQLLSQKSLPRCASPLTRWLPKPMRVDTLVARA